MREATITGARGSGRTTRLITQLISDAVILEQRSLLLSPWANHNLSLYRSHLNEDADLAVVPRTIPRPDLEEVLNVGSWLAVGIDHSEEYPETVRVVSEYLEGRPDSRLYLVRLGPGKEVTS